MTSAISLSDITFTYAQNKPPVFTNVTCNIKPAARVVLVGANGAGKSTLLRLVAGRRRASAGTASVLGGDAFECTENISRVNLVTADWEAELSLPVAKLVSGAIAACGASAGRVAKLLEVLGVAELLHAELNNLSDGQQRRVQLFCKLLPERELVLLDEATNSLDIVSRSSLLSFLREESEVRGCTVVFATHIFDGLDGWATELAHLDGGRLLRHVSADALPNDQTLYQVVSTWLLEHAREVREQFQRSGAPKLETIAAALVAQAAKEAAEAKSTYALDTAPAWPKRNRPDTPAEPPRESPNSGRPTSSLAGFRPGQAEVGSIGGGGGGSSLPEGWGNRTATLTDGAFGAHRWGPTAPDGVEEQPPGLQQQQQQPPAQMAASAAPAPATAAKASAPTAPLAESPPPRKEKPPPNTPPLPQPPPNPPAEQQQQQEPRLAAQVAAASLPPAAQRMAPALQGVLSMLTTRVGACSAAVGSGDAAAAASAAAEIQNIWAQAQMALKQYEAAFSSGGGASGGGSGSSGAVREMPRGSGMYKSEVGGGGLPEGWGNRHSSEEELVRRGIIMPEAKP